MHSSRLVALSGIAQRAALSAGALMCAALEDKLSVRYKRGADCLEAGIVTATDLACDARIRELLIPHCEGDIAILSEETADDGERLRKPYFWCIDPIDGTLAYSQGKAGCAVAIALLSREGQPLLGVIYDPIKDTLYSAIKEQGAFRNQCRWHLTEPGGGYLTVPVESYFLAQPEAGDVLQLLEQWAIGHGYRGLNLLRDGGSVMSALWVAENPAACYFKWPTVSVGRGSSWDFAASSCILSELGVPIVDFDGVTPTFNRPETTDIDGRGLLVCTDPAVAAYLTACPASTSA